jgi:hypothetical protein
MTRIKAHNPAKQVTGGDSSRSLPAGGGGGGSAAGDIWTIGSIQQSILTETQLLAQRPANGLLPMVAT